MSRSTGRPASNAPAPAELLDNRYRLETLLGRGGMGVVYRALDTRLGRPVAVKVLRAAEDADEQRFLAEVRILAGFNHANLVRLLDAGDFDGRPYLVMDLIDGPTLSQRLATIGVTRQQSARIGADVALALSYVHERGVVHRDVKPANVLLDADGISHLTDFGIARLIDTTGMTATGLTLGTPAYLAPEQVQGIGVGPAADVYALGLVLVECVTGRRAFEGTASELAAARLTREADIPRELGSEWEATLRSMTRRDPGARIRAVDAAEQLSMLAGIQDLTAAPIIRPAGPGDLTAVLASPLEVHTARLGSTVPTKALSDQTVTSRSLTEAPRRRTHRSLRIVALALGVVIAVVGLSVGEVFSSSPGRPAAAPTSTTLRSAPATSSSTTTTSSTTTSSTTISSTTIPIPDVVTAAGALQSVLYSGESDGSIASPVAQQLYQQLQPLVNATDSGSSDQLVQAFDQFVQTFDQAEAAGAITSDTTSNNMTAAIDTLAAALGTTTPTTSLPPTTDTTTTLASPGDGNAFGHGHGQ